MAFSACSAIFQGNGGVAVAQEKLCTLSKQTPAPARSHPEFLRSYDFDVAKEDGKF
ncbi:hypothetical protein PITCH_A140051 [uncultured Desulfobacterium sp.]|uniref:Uncharacterized protein n=1 Tax=uncultured Desulfobacterium sp. TaxID=201089 RepID=A0A445MT75_9BACT|nr:hypothetical protein PITCH_A140051 [uncultured Desulfobacterium sp.]